MSGDPNVNHPAVKVYRDILRLMPNWGFRKDIVATVKDLDLWTKILTEWRERKWNRWKINWMLSEYERRQNR